MKAVLFDLGRTLEHNDVLLPGATDLLNAVEAMRDADGNAPLIGLVSDFHAATTPAEVMTRQKEYYAILDTLGVRSRFEPVAKRVTLSTEVGAFKPDKRVFRAALDRLQTGLGFADAIFTTERLDHVTACRALGMRAIHFKGPGQTTGDVDNLRDVIPILKDFVKTRSDAGLSLS